MSAPDTKALPPAPVSTTTRIDGSAPNSASMSDAACHISNDTALCLSGLLKMRYPTPPPFRAHLLSLCVRSFIPPSLYHLSLMERGDVAIGKPEFLGDFVGVLTDVRRRGDDFGGSA